MVGIGFPRERKKSETSERDAISPRLFPPSLERKHEQVMIRSTIQLETNEIIECEKENKSDGKLDEGTKCPKGREGKKKS